MDESSWVNSCAGTWTESAVRSTSRGGDPRASRSSCSGVRVGEGLAGKDLRGVFGSIATRFNVVGLICMFVDERGSWQRRRKLARVKQERSGNAK